MGVQFFYPIHLRNLIPACNPSLIEPG